MVQHEKPFLNEASVLAHECVEAYLQQLKEYMYHGTYNNDADLYEANRVLRSYAKSALRAIVEHMP